MKVTFFYRDGNNYKCVFEHNIDKEVWNDFMASNEGEDILGTDHSFDIKEFDLDMYDIPLIAQYGASDMDHPYVSILSFGEE